MSNLYLYPYTKTKTAAVLTGISLMFFAVSCRSSETENIGGTAAIKINLKSSSFENIGELTKQASVKSNLPDQNLIQHQEIKLDDKLSVVAELIPQNTNPEPQAIASNTNRPMAATDPTLLPNDICYKLLVYDNNGNYVAERDYIRGKENNTTVTPALILNGDHIYTFIAYSVNTNTIASLPVITNKNTLAGAILNDITGNADLMYFKSTPVKMEGGKDNYLDIILKHMFSQITTTLDVSQTGYKIHTIDAGITPHNNKANLQLTDGSITRSDSGTTPVQFALPNGNDISAYPAAVSNINMVNNDAINNCVFTITSIRLGLGDKTTGVSIVNKNIKIENLKITPGVKYKLNINLVPADTYLTYMGVPAVRINGQIWMRYNLGVTNMDIVTNNPDQTPQVRSLNGNYYVYGNPNPAATAYSPSYTNVTQKPGIYEEWMGVKTGGTLYAPVKSTLDPCPSGYRIPTGNEWQMLANNTTTGNIGTWIEDWDGGTNFSAGKIFRSKKNTNVQLTLPAGGFWHGGVHINARGYAGYYWASNASSSDYVKYAYFNENAIQFPYIYGMQISYNQASIRCIADTPN